MTGRPAWLSDRARGILEGSSLSSRLWTTLTGRPPDAMPRLPVLQADLVEGWDELDYRAERFEPFLGVGDLRVLIRDEDDTTSFVVLRDGRAVDVMTGISFPSPGEAALAFAWLAAATDDGRIDPEEERALLAFRLALRLDDRSLSAVKERLASILLWRIGHGEVTGESALETVTRLAEALVLRPDAVTAALVLGMAADAAVLARLPALDEDKLAFWRAASRARGLSDTAVDACERRLRRAHRIHRARLGELPVLSSVTLNLRDGELLHWTGPVVVYRTEPGLNPPPPPPDPLEPLPLPVRLPDEPAGQLRRMGSGALHLTSHRLVWMGPRGVTDCPVTDLTTVEGYRTGLVLRGAGPFANRFLETAGADTLHIALNGLLTVYRGG